MNDGKLLEEPKNIVEFNPKYEEGLKELVSLALKHVGVDINKYPEILDEIKAEYIRDTYEGRSRFWIKSIDGKVVGSIAVIEDWRDEKTAEIKRMFVLPEFHGSGVGRDLLNTAMEFIKCNDYGRTILHTDKEMIRAQSFYEKNGFIRFRENDDVVSYEFKLE
jgi:ribosomal protein S18 acetylase RimI-like enzyme